MVLQIAYRNNKYLVPLDPENRLSELYDAASEISGRSPDEITLVFGGMKLNEGAFPLSMYGIRPNSCVLCLPMHRSAPSAADEAADHDGHAHGRRHHRGGRGHGRGHRHGQPDEDGAEAPAQTEIVRRAAELGVPDMTSLPPFATSFASFHPPAKCTPQERKQMEALARLLHTEHERVAPFIQTYIEAAVRALDPATPDAQRPTAQALQTEYSRAAELPLQSLLKIDGIEAPDGSALIRGKRKEAVKLIQSWLSVVDGVKARLAE